MDKYIINGGERLNGRVQVHSAKNAVLPLLAASILTDEPITLHKIPILPKKPCSRLRNGCNIWRWKYWQRKRE